MLSNHTATMRNPGASPAAVAKKASAPALALAKEDIAAAAVSAAPSATVSGTAQVIGTKVVPTTPTKAGKVVAAARPRKSQPAPPTKPPQPEDSDSQVSHCKSLFLEGRGGGLSHRLAALGRCVG